MLPESRQNGYLYEIPQYMVEKREVVGFVHELNVFHRKFADCFVRSDPRDSFYQDLVGQLSSVERKAIEPIAVNTCGRYPVVFPRTVVRSRGWGATEAMRSAGGVDLQDQTAVRGREVPLRLSTGDASFYVSGGGYPVRESSGLHCGGSTVSWEDVDGVPSRRYAVVAPAAVHEDEDGSR
jgi:hypothetical protein